MKSNRFLAALCFTASLSLAPVFAQTPIDDAGFVIDKYWPLQAEPVLFVMGRRPPSINGVDFSDDSVRAAMMDYLASVSNAWQQEVNIRYSFLRGCVHGDSPAAGCSSLIPRPEGNGNNEIMFNAIPEGGWGNAIGRADFDIEFDNFCSIPRPASRVCLNRKIKEVDIFIQARSTGWAMIRDIASCNRSLHTFYVEPVFLHEMGHALGAPHTRGIVDIMHRDAFLCQDDNWFNVSLSAADINSLRAIYGPPSPVDVAIQQPTQNEVLFPGRSIALSADAFFTRDPEIVEDWGSIDIRWETSGREIASGSSAFVDTDAFIPGDQELKAVARSSSGIELGSSSVSVKLITDFLVDDEFVVFPMPCISLAGSFSDRCLLRLRESWSTFACDPPVGFSHEVSARDLITGSDFTVLEPSYYRSPWGFGCRDNSTHDLYFGIWATTPNPQFLLDFDHAIFKFGVFDGSNSVTGLVHKTEPVLEEFSISDSCQIDRDGNRCGVDVSWDGLYFAPSSALFFRRDGGDRWRKVIDLGLNAGSIQTSGVVPFSGGQFAVFQYGTDFRVPSSSQFGTHQTLISAPAGRLAGPFSVDAVIPGASVVSPKSGHWGSEARDGTGLNISRSSNGNTLVIWYTYDHDGKSIWYISQPALEQDGVFVALLEKMTWRGSTQTTRRTVVGEIAYTSVAEDRIIVDVVLDDGLNEQSSSVAMTHRIGGEFNSGLWNEPALKGWGFNMNSQLVSGVQRNFVVSITYRIGGAPRWELGEINGSLLQHTAIPMQEVRRSVSCPTCNPVQYALDSQPVGHLAVGFGGTPGGWVNIVGRDGGDWIRGSAANPLTWQAITLRSAFFGD